MTVREYLTVAGFVASASAATAGPAVHSIVMPSALVKELAPAIPVDRVKAAVAGLAASDFEVREKAHAEILAMGEKGFPQLKGAQSTVTDAEARRRLAVIVQKLDFDRLSTARKVTLVTDRITAPNALKQIAHSAGYRFRAEGLGEEIEKKKVYSFNLKDKPFWEATDAICNASGLGLQVEEDGTIRAFNQDAYSPNVSYSGPFRIVANQIHASRYLQLSGLSRQALPASTPESLSLNMTVFAEPKTTIVGTRGPTLVKIIDEWGKTVPQPPIDQNTSYYGGSGYKGFAQNLHLGFSRPAKDATKLKEIRAKAQLIVLTETRPDAVVNDLPKSKGKKYRGQSADIEITDVAEANGTATVTATITNPTGNPNDYQWVNSLWQRFEVTDAKGEKFTVNITSTSYNSAQQVTVTFQATPNDGIKCGPPATFTLVEWVTRTVDVEFAFKDVPLP
jgi:hypothetical protein